MENFNEKRINENGYRIHLIQSKKFKTVNLVVKLKAPLEKRTVTKRALLPYILKQGTKNYPNVEKLQEKLDELYGAVLAIRSDKKGENHIITLRMEIANPSFIPNAPSILEEGISLLNELIFEPNVHNHAFDDIVVEREMETLKQRIHSIKDDKMQYANMRLIDEMCKGEPYSLHVHGYEEDLTEINGKDLYEYYQKMMKEDELDIYVLGDFNEGKMKELIQSTVKREKVDAQDRSKVKRVNHQVEPKEVIEKQNVQQAKLHIGYRTYVSFKDDDYFALQVFNGIFGGFPNSKLFINVREKNSLAYYAASRMESHKGLLFVFSGIAPEDFEKARDIIREQLVAMKNGDFTEENLQETKDLIINQIKETIDNSQGMIEILYQQVVGEKEMTLGELLNGINAVTKEQVMKVADKIEEDTVYLLTNEGGQNSAS